MRPDTHARRDCDPQLDPRIFDLGMSTLCEGVLRTGPLERMEPFYPLCVLVGATGSLVRCTAYVQLDEPLHQIREHGKRYTRQAQSARLRAACHDATTRRTAQGPILNFYATCHAIDRDAALTATKRWACLMILSRWWLVNWNSARVMVDLGAVPMHNLVGLAEWLKPRLVGAAARGSGAVPLLVRGGRLIAS